MRIVKEAYERMRKELQEDKEKGKLPFYWVEDTDKEDEIESLFEEIHRLLEDDPVLSPENCRIPGNVLYKDDLWNDYYD